MRYLAPIPSQFLDENGEPYYGGMVHVYVHGEPRHAEIYQNAQTDELAQNPFPLDSHGSWQAFVDADKTFDYLVMDSGGNVVARFPEITFPTGEGVPEVSVVSPDGSINVNEVVDETGKTFEIEVNRDILEPSYSEFSHDTVTGNGGAAVLDSFTLESDADADIYLTEGVLTFKKGLYHVSMNLVIGNSVESGAYYDIVVDFGGNELKKTWDGSFVHEESVELGMDVTADQDGHTVIPSIVELPEGMYCRVSRLDVHKVCGAGVGGSGAPIEHDGSLEGDGTHGNPLGVKDYSEIRTDLAEVIEGFDSHKTDPTAHQDIRDELERKEDKDNKVTSWGGTLSDEKYPSEKLVKDTIDNLPPGTAVKGDAETEYRTGNVNLTPANIGSYSKTESDSLLSVKENAINKKQSVDPTSTTDYLSAKAVADFVNSSVATNTANFLGNFSLTDLGLTYPATDVQIAAALNSHTWPSGVTPTNNDYVYVEIQNPQTTGVDDKVERFKYSGLLESWGYEYTLNNSSFTAAEIAAIESGITATDKGYYDAHLANTSNPHGVTKAQVGLGSVVNTGDSATPISGGTTKFTTGGAFTELAKKADKVSGATSGNLAGLDSNGNITDSGKKAADFEPSFSVLPISKGGTGGTTGKEATKNLFADINSNTADFSDGSTIVSRYGSPNASSGVFFYRTAIYLWNYINGKISSVLGLSENGYTGNAATATTASNYASGGGIDTALQGKLDSTGDASNTTATFTKATGDASTMASGGKLSVIFTAISSFFALLKALAFKDKASYSDLSSGVQASLDKADSALQSHQSVNDNNPTLAWGATSTVGTVGSTDLQVTMPANPATGKIDVVSEEIGSTAINLDSITSPSGETRILRINDSYKANVSNKPIDDSGNVVVLSQGGAHVRQLFFTQSDNTIYVRTRDNAQWSNWIKMRDASWINSGTFGTDRIADDAITAAKVKDNETLPVNIRGSANNLRDYLTLQSGAGGENITYQEIGTSSARGASGSSTTIVLQGQGDVGKLPSTWMFTFHCRSTDPVMEVYSFGPTYSRIKFGYWKDSNNIFHFIARYPAWCKSSITMQCINRDIGFTFDVKSATTTEPTGAVYATTYNTVSVSYGQNVGDSTTPVYVDSNGQVKPCTPSGGVMKSNAAELYIAGYDGTIPYYHVRGIKNGCVNYVHVKDIPFNTCSITIDAPTLVSGEEYDYVVVFDTFTNSNLVGNIDVENCKKAGHMDNGVFVVDSMYLASANPHYVPMVVVTGNVASSKWYERL